MQDDAVRRLLVIIQAPGEGSSFLGNGFLVSPRHVLTAEAIFAPSGDASASTVDVLFVGIDVAATTATLVARIPEAHAALLELAKAVPPEVVIPPLDGRLPPSGASWTSAFGKRSTEIVHVNGIVLSEEGPTIPLSPNPTTVEGTPATVWPPPLGAPIAIEQGIAAMVVPPIDPVQSSPPWRAVTAKRLLATSAAAIWQGALDESAAPSPAQSTSRPVVDALAGFMERLAPSARRAINHANAIRARMGQPELHMEHLLVALAEKPEGVPRRLLFTAAALDQKKLRALVLEVVRVQLPADYLPLETTTLPALSRHVQRAFTGALTGASRRRPGIDSPPLEAADLFYGALSVANCSLIVPLLEKGLTPERVLAYAPSDEAKQPSDRYILANVGSDQPKGIDRLDITGEVEALGLVVAASSTEPPVAIGLFGEWGSGKSFFMDKLRQQVEVLAGESTATGNASFCREIVQIPFNAWHYVDTNLWASLLTELFEGLSAHLEKKTGETDAVKRARLLTRVSSTRDVIAEAQKEKAAAEGAVAVATARIDRLETERQRVESTLTGGVVLAAVRDLLVGGEETFRRDVDSAIAALGVPVDKATTDFKAELVEANRAFKLWKGLSQGFDLRVKMSLVAALAVLAAVVALRAHWISIAAWWGPLKVGALLPAAMALGAAARVLLPWVGHAWKAMRALGAARARQKDAIEAATRKKKGALEEEKRQLQSKASEAHVQLDRANADLRQLEAEIDGLRADRKMIDFIRERSTSTDYSRYQGIMARAQHDFELLSNLLKEKRYEDVRPELPTIDRIVLYIDDLDRCPEDKVFDVLQAVHLLLAYPLFVVVVGVDPRWLLHSVRARAKALGGPSDGKEKAEVAAAPRIETEWVATPMDYLEKIFQIPFTLRPMEKGGFEKLVDSLSSAAETDAHAQPKKEPPPDPPKPPPAAPRPESPASPSGGVPSPPAPGGAPPAGPATAAGSGTPAGAAGVVAAAAAARSRKVERLEFTEPEKAFMKRLYKFIHSPRATKRFVNVYRLVRASADEGFDDLVGDAEWGDHRAVLLLLAILTGYPEQATVLLAALLTRHHDETWWQFVEGFRTCGVWPATPPADESRSRERESQQWRELFERLDALKQNADIPLHKSCSYFERWARQVARYSFQSGRVLIAQRPSDEAAPEVSGA